MSRKRSFGIVFVLVSWIALAAAWSPPPTEHVEVRVTDPEGAALAEASVHLAVTTPGLNIAPFLDRATIRVAATTDEEGLARVELPPGRPCHVWATSNQGNPLSSEVELQVEAGQSVELRCIEATPWKRLGVEGFAAWQKVAGEDLSLLFLCHSHVGLRWTRQLPAEGSSVELPELPASPCSVALVDAEGGILTTAGLPTRRERMEGGVRGRHRYVQHADPDLCVASFEGPDPVTPAQPDSPDARFDVQVFDLRVAPVHPIGPASVRRDGRSFEVLTSRDGRTVQGFSWAHGSYLQDGMASKEPELTMGTRHDWRVAGAPDGARFFLRPFGFPSVLRLDVGDDGALTMPDVEGDPGHWDVFALSGGSFLPVYSHPGGPLPNEQRFDLETRRRVRIQLQAPGQEVAGGRVYMYGSMASAAAGSTPVSWVMLPPDPAPEFTADANGTAELELLPGDYVFVAAHGRLGQGLAVAKVEESTEPLDIELELAPYRELPGRISGGRKADPETIRVEARLLEDPDRTPEELALWRGVPRYDSAARTAQSREFTLRVPAGVSGLEVFARADGEDEGDRNYEATAQPDSDGEIRLRFKYAKNRPR